MRVLVTGGAGFIGSAVIRLLARETDCRILNLDKLTYAANPLAIEAAATSSHYAFERADIGDRGAVGRILGAFRPDAIMNLAAETHVDRSIDGPAAFVETNVVGLVSLLRETTDYWRALDASARRDFRFHHVSTDEVFGALGDLDPAFTETSAYDPRSPYSASKAASDHFVRVWHHTYDLPVVISNCSNNYGPWQFPEKLIPLMIVKAFRGERLPVYGKGANVRDWLHVDDHARALWAILSRGRVGESYIVGGNAERRNLAVVEAICDSLDRLAGMLPTGPRRGLLAFVQDRPGHDFRYAMNPAKIAGELDWRPTVTFEAGLEATVAWYLENSDWWAGLGNKVYGGERLGLATPSSSP
ncbi:MAG: dTDP-glucose 4,6-dehydratase [Alphaproteobacteria bacterium]|nr:dTDP-glucose 4,6-dehydratase [Alphaproteobacteria bacterium]